MESFWTHSRSFTILELLIVVLIIALTAGVAIPTYLKAVRRARIKEAEAQLELIYDAEKSYYLDNKKYIDSVGQIDKLGINVEDSKYFSYSFETNGSLKAKAVYKGTNCIMTINIESQDRDIVKKNCDF